jgi:hypothetical protein
MIEVKDVSDALKRLDEEIQKRVKNALGDSGKLYEAHKFKEAALALDEAMKLQAFQPVLAYDLALCYHQLGEGGKALEYVTKAKAGTADPKQKQKLQPMLTFFTTGRERGFAEAFDWIQEHPEPPACVDPTPVTRADLPLPSHIHIHIERPGIFDTRRGESNGPCRNFFDASHPKFSSKSTWEAIDRLLRAILR